MSFLPGMTWKHPDYDNVVIHSIPIPLKEIGELPNDMSFLSTPEFQDVVEVFMPFISQEKYGQPDHPKALSYAFKNKEKGNEKFRDGEYIEAFKLYQCSWRLFQLIEKVYPETESEIVHVLSNLSATCCKLNHGKDGLEYAEQCLRIDPMFFKGHFRRAEARKIMASTMETQTDEQQKKCMEYLMYAMQDYMKCYEKMVDPVHQSSRIKQYCEALKMAIVMNCCSFMPKLHKEDVPIIANQVMDYAINEYQPKLTQDLLDFLLFMKPEKKGSGIVHLYPCDFTGYSIRPFVRKGVLSSARVEGLIKLNFVIEDSDIMLALQDESHDNEYWYTMVEHRCKSLDKSSNNYLTDIYDYAVKGRKEKFMRYLVEVQGARPCKLACLRTLATFKDLPMHRKLFSQCSVAVRTELVLYFFSKREEEHLDLIIGSGDLNLNHNDIGKLFSSSLTAKKPQYISKLLKHGAIPNGSSTTGLNPITVLVKSSLPLKAKVEILVMLLEDGGNITKLKSFYPDPMSVVHIATRLAIETENMDVLKITCKKFSFPDNGRLVDKANQTPLHVAVLAKDESLGIKALEILTKYKIDKDVKDIYHKKAEDYVQGRNDKGRLKYVKQVKKSEPPAVREVAIEDLDFIDDVELEESPKFNIVIADNDDDDDQEKEEEVNLMPPPNAHIIDMSKFKFDGDPTPPSYGVDGKHKGKWEGDWARYLTPYDPTDKRTEAHFQAMVQQLKHMSMNYIRTKSFENAVHAYMQAINQYDTWQKGYPSTDLDREKALSYLNMSLCLFKLKRYKDSLTAADEACSLLPKYYKAYHRKAMAQQHYAQFGLDSGHNCPEVNRMFVRAMQGYATAYTLMTDPSQVKYRSTLICSILRVGLQRESPEFIPKFHKCDESSIVTKVIEGIVSTEKDPKKKCEYIDVVLVKSIIPKSGFGAKYPCKMTNLSLAELLPFASFLLLKAILSRGYTVRLQDLEKALVEFTESQMDHMNLLVDNLKGNITSKRELQLTTKLCNHNVSKKMYFVPLLISLGAKPSANEITKLKEFHELDPITAEYVVKVCSASYRTVALKKCLNTSSKHHVQLIVSMGENCIVPEDFNLTEFIHSSIFLKKPDLVEDLIKAGVSPTGLIENYSPLALLCSSKIVTHTQLVRIGEILVSHGASVRDLKEAFEDRMTPIHIATKLVLETGIISFLKVVCSKISFPLSGKVIDSHQQTPFHLATRAKYNEKSIQVCEVLCQYCIDPKLKDQWNKTAHDYCRTKNDKRLPFLKKAAKTIEEMNRRKSTVPIDESTQSEEPAGGGKKKRKKKKRNKKEKKDEELDSDGGEDQEDEVVSCKQVTVPVKPTVDHYYNINTLLSKLMAHTAGDYFISTTESSPTPYESSSTTGRKSSADFTWITEELDTSKKMKDYFKSIVQPKDLVASIDDQPWEVECTETVLKFLKSEKCPLVMKTEVVNTISSLATGNWSLLKYHKVAPPISDTKDNLTLYEVELTPGLRIIWDVSVQFSAKCTTKDICGATPTAPPNMSLYVFTEVIRVWDIVPNNQRRIDTIKNIFKSRNRGLQANVNFSLYPQSLSSSSKERIAKLNLPKKFLLKEEVSDPGHASNPYSHIERYCPAASIKEDEFNVFVFYGFTSDLISCMLGSENARRDFPFKEWPKEHDIINMPHNREAILLIGRSGTGKTTCCLYRLWYQFSNYWEEAGAIGACQPRRPLMIRPPNPIPDCDDGRLLNQQDSTTSKHIEMEHLHQVFITKNYVLCSQMKKRFYDMAASYPNLSYHMQYENQPDPVDLDSVHNMAFPLFLTSRQFLLMLDASLGLETSFFPRNKDGSLAIKIISSDYENSNPDALLDIEDSDDEDSILDDGDDSTFIPMSSQTGSKSTTTWYEVTSLYFIDEIWPKISSGITCNVDPLLVWIEIRSFIKGSAQALETSQGYLTEQEYLTLGKKMASNFVGNRQEVYKIFLRYESFLQKKRSLNLFDDCQLVHNVYQRLVSMEMDPSWSIHNFYIDEVQDFTQSELSVFIQCCREPNDLFFTGDTAQSIMRGIAFRFSDLRSLFHYANEKSTQSMTPFKIHVPIIQNLAINFRSHAGILQLATSIMDLMKNYFPNSFDVLPEDKGMFPGPMPVFLQSCQISDLALLLKSNKRTSSVIEFGAHQVIIVQNDSAKNRLPEVLKTGIVLTVFESKGLEFDDVLLYNFFTDSTVDKEWRVVTSYANQFHPSSSSTILKDKPRPLEFNEREHKSLNSEFKYLYTAITRAKCNLWIYDSDESRRLPIFDYWIRRNLVKVIRMGENEEGERSLFTATSTHSQWREQGDYFRRKGLWEPAAKCYRKADCPELLNESEAYMYAQMAKSAKSDRETRELFEKAACAFLYCDHIQHNVRHLVNAAKCLRNCKRHLEAAKLFEKLGESELAKRSFLKANDPASIVRIRVAEGDYSGAVRVFARSNRKLQALETSQQYEKQGKPLDPDVSSFQLANEYAKYFIVRKDEDNLRKVLSFVDDPLVRVAHLKKARMFHLALEEYLNCGKLKEAVDLILAQEMYTRGLELAKGGKELKKGVKLEPQLQVYHATSLIYHSRGLKNPTKADDQKTYNTVSEILLSLSRNQEQVYKCKARLLSGIIQANPSICQEAMNLYQNCATPDVVGNLESFNQVICLGKTDISIRFICNQCFQANEVSLAIVQKSAKATQIMKMAVQFYHLSHLESVYLIPKSQDIWFGNLYSIASTKDKPTDDNGMRRLDPDELRTSLSVRYQGFVNDWMNKTMLVKRLKERLHEYRFHKDLSEDRPLTLFHEGFSIASTNEYIEFVDFCMRINKLDSRSFDNQLLAKLVPNIFSPPFSLCIPVSKANGSTVLKCSTIREGLQSDIEYFLEERSLVKSKVDELFDAWQCSCLVNSVVAMEKQLEEFAIKKGPGNIEHEKTKHWLFVDRKGKMSYHHFFSYLLKAYRLIRESCQVIGSVKIIFHCFLAVVSRRPVLRKKLSIYNLINVVNVCTMGLVALLTVDNPELGLVLPYCYRFQCQIFDDLNIQESNQYWLLTACVRQVSDLSENRLERLVNESYDHLIKLLSFLLGDFCEQYDVLDSVLNENSEEIVLTHVVVSVLVLIANIRLVSNDSLRYVSECMTKVISSIKLKTKVAEGKFASILTDLYSQLSQSTSVYDILNVVQVILSKYKYPNSIAKLVITKTWNMDFKEITPLPTHLRDIRVIYTKETKKPLKVTQSLTPTKGDKASNVGSNTKPISNSPSVSQATPTVVSQPTITGQLSSTQPTVREFPPSLSTAAAASSSDTVLQTLQQQLMFILQQKQQLDQYRVLLSQQLISLQQSPLEDLGLYQQQLLQLRQQEYQANEALRQLELQHQQINFKMLQHYNTQKLATSAQTQPISGSTANPQVKQPPTSIPANRQPPTSIPGLQMPTNIPVNQPATNVLVNQPSIPVNHPELSMPPVNKLPISLPVIRPPTNIPVNQPEVDIPVNQMPPSIPVNQPLPPSKATKPPMPFPFTIPPQMPVSQAPPSIVIQPTSSVDTISRESSTEAVKRSPLHEIFFDSKSPSPIGTRAPQDGGMMSSSFSEPHMKRPLRGNLEEEIMDDEMEHLLVQSSQSDFFAPSAGSSVMGGGTQLGDDSELVDQYYCQVCGVSFKSEGSETNLEETNASLASMFLNTANFETHDDHVRSKAHQDNYIAHSQFMTFKEQAYSEPRKQLDALLDNTAQINSANLDKFVFTVRSKLREFDEEIEEYQDGYKWRIAHSRSVAFVDEIIAMNRQLMKMRSSESAVQKPQPTHPSFTAGGIPQQQNLAELVFVDEEDDYEFEYDDLVRGAHTDIKKRKKSTQKK